ncbi:MAG: hypothetical protein JST30_16860 [Armatimonadetes bacterium]|nr:hypothetical protein [Armatimonadota bacterium]
MGSDRNAPEDNPLWTCPECGNRFVTAKMWHSCGTFALDGLFLQSSREVRGAYDALEAMARELADIIVTPQKTRIAFQTRTRFSGGVPKRDHFDAGFVFFRRHPSPRFYKIEDYSAKWFVHRTRLTCAADVDDEVRQWLVEALEYGDQCRTGRFA